MRKFLLTLTIFLVSFTFLYSFPKRKIEKSTKKDFDTRTENKITGSWEKMDDFEAEMEDEELTLRFFDATEKKLTPLSDGSVEIKGVGTFKTDHEGKVRFKTIDDGTYSFVFKKEGYITSKLSFRVRMGVLFFNRYSISKVLKVGQVRVVLDWSKEPADLDAHLKKEGVYHISFRDMRKYEDLAMLDRDDMDGEGPETVTVNRVDQKGDYLFFIHDYTNQSDKTSSKLSTSKATIKVYGEQNKLLKVYHVPVGKMGTKWEVFKIHEGQIIDIMKVK